MSDPEQPQTATLHNEYASKVEADLDKLQKERARLASRLDQVERELALLLRLKDAMSEQEPVTAAEPAPPPARPKDGAAPRKRTAGKAAGKTTPRAGRTTAKKPAPKKPAPKKPAAGKAAPEKTAPEKAADGKTPSAQGPTVRQKIVDYLAEAAGPRSSSEVADELRQRHNGFTSSQAAVRTALEALVAQGQAERSKQGRSVYYAVPAAKQDDQQPAAGQPDETTPSA